VKKLLKKFSPQNILKGLLLGALLLLPLLIQNGPYAYYIRSLGLIGLYALLALGLNFTLGYAGLFDLGYIAFYAIGAYTAALASIHGWGFLPAAFCAVVLAVAVRFLEGIPILRLRGDYLAIVTMGFGEITRLVLNNLDSLTNGPKGLPRVGENIYPARLLGFTLTTNTHYYYLILILVLLAVVISYRLEHSRLGRAWVAIREDELAAELSGIPVAKMKLLAFVISGGFAAIGGCVFAFWERFVTPESFVFWESVLIVAMIVAGGMGSIGGVLLGALILGGIPQILQVVLVGSRWIDYRYFFFGLILVLTVMFRPQGLLPSQRRKTEMLGE